MADPLGNRLEDTGERMIPTLDEEVSVVFARHKFAYECAKRFVGGKDVLDLGCGTGYGVDILASAAKVVLGVDSNYAAIEYCRMNYSANNIRFEVRDAQNLSLGRIFDVSISFQVIEHMRDASAFINTLKAHTRKRGVILLSTPNVKHRLSADRRNPFHYSEMTYDEFDSLLKDHFDEYQLLGIGHDKNNRLRELLQKFRFYRIIGLALRRGNPIKKFATRALDLTSYRLLETGVEEKSIDLFAVCKVM